MELEGSQGIETKKPTELTAGFNESGEVKTGRGVILSTYNYGQLWCGEARGRIPKREDIRTAVEWGTNILYYVLSLME